MTITSNQNCISNLFVNHSQIRRRCERNSNDGCWSSRPGGCDTSFQNFTGAEEGFIVGVANTSCTTNPNVCGGQQCARVTYDPWPRMGNCKDLTVECNGILGDVVYVQLPGNARRMGLQHVHVQEDGV